ncbi:mitoguardin 2-like [Lineus longissimus]|uniref:mitoguardin 2-like n=1 Tax=Lineus longissimus TaxID=88925 RepID=UPI002B4EBA10
MPLNNPAKATILGITLGVTLIGILAAYLRRRKPRSPRKSLPKVEPSVASSVNRSRTVSRGTSQASRSSPALRSPNGDIPSALHSHQSSPGVFSRPLSLQGDACSVGSTGSTSTVTRDTSNLSPQHLCQLGLDSINTAVHHWEDALNRIEPTEPDGDAASDLKYQLENLIDRACQIQEEYERRLYRQASTAALDSAMVALSEMDRYYERDRRITEGETDSDQDSFVSASEMADLTDLEQQTNKHQSLFLYEAALLELKHGSIPCRSLRTRLVGCESDSEFLGKLHCLRFAFEELFRDETILEWFVQMGRRLISYVLIKAERDPVDFQEGFDEMINFVKKKESWQMMEEELRGRGIKVLSFYDIVLDFILMDAFDDLESPPSSVTTVVQNRWLSNGFKETALATAVWSVLKAKRRLLRIPDGFIAHFYAISEHVSPVLAWGFLGPVVHLNEMCQFFKDQVLEFIKDIFNFDKVRFTTIPELADDIIAIARERSQIAEERLSS